MNKKLKCHNSNKINKTKVYKLVTNSTYKIIPQEMFTLYIAHNLCASGDERNFLRPKRQKG